MKIYEFAGYMNAGNSGRGIWYEDFPYKMDGTHVKPRTTFYDSARGIESSENWQAYIISGDICEKEKWVGEFPENADYITTSPIQCATFHTISHPIFTVVKGYEYSIHRDCISNTQTIWTVETVPSFITREGKVIMHV